jgi:hypothetical protein
MYSPLVFLGLGAWGARCHRKQTKQRCAGVAVNGKFSFTTVKTPRLEIFQPLGVETRSAATLRALEVLGATHHADPR